MTDYMHFDLSIFSPNKNQIKNQIQSMQLLPQKMQPFFGLELPIWFFFFFLPGI